MHKTIVWFRNDLRIADNDALSDGIKSGAILPIYIYDTNTPSELSLGAASKVWLHHSLNDLQQSFHGKLNLFIGNPLDIINQLVEKYKIKQVNWNGCYDKYQIKRDTQIKQSLTQQQIIVKSFNGSLLWEPWTILKADHTPYKVFTPYYRKGCLGSTKPREPIITPTINECLHTNESIALNQLKLLPNHLWHLNLTKHWDISEKAALKQLDNFIDNKIIDYKIGRDVPAEGLTSLLSPYLHFGQISPHYIWYKVLAYGIINDSVDSFFSELGWREFSYYLLYHFPTLYKDNWQVKFNQFPWQYNSHNLTAWQTGQTGIPIVDAGMRQLWQTGYMHNRVRMIVASFLTKNLLIDWRYGAKWFLDTLFDADIASNSASWQWVAGSGADAQPYFRIFNPVTQAEKFDNNGEYIKRYVPELKNLPVPYLFAPWLAPSNILNQSNVVLGNTYPQPIVNLSESRLAALAAFKQL